jgi:hypothetical protein
MLLALFIVGFIGVQPAEAKRHHSKSDVRGVQVASVDVANSKITLTIDHNQQTNIYLIPMGTALTIDGVPAKLSSVESGMYVVSYTEGDAGTLSQLDVSKTVVK